VIRCGVLDTMLAELPVSVVFFFDRPLDEDRLAAGLAVALRRVPTFAGRLRIRDGALELVCADAGVPLTAFDIEEPLADAMARVTLPASGFVEHVDAPRIRSDGLPMMSVQLSRLAGGGTALGCSWNHAAGDMQTFMLFMRAWSAAVEGAALPTVSIVEDSDRYLDRVLPRGGAGRLSLRLPEPDEAGALRREVDAALRTNRTIQIYLTGVEVDRMRHEFEAAAGRWLSAGDAVCAHMVTALRQVGGDTEVRHLAVPVNLRRRYGIPAGAVGNLLGEVYLACPPDAGPAALAARIRSGIDDFTGGHLTFRADRAFLDRVGRSRLGDCVPVGFDPVRRTVSFSNLTGFGVYDLAFEGRHPVLFSMAANVPLPWVSWLVEGFENTGYLYTVAVPARLAARLRAPEGWAVLHRFREPGDPLPGLAGTARKLL
jgi:hypothetical protein